MYTRDELANSGRLPLPENWEPEGTRCVPILLPDDPEWVIQFLGQAWARLAIQKTWARDPSRSGAATVAERWRLVAIENQLQMHATCADIIEPGEEGPPYWEDEEDADGVDGELSTWDKIGVWIFTGFFFFAAGEEAAIWYKHAATKVQIRYRQAGWGGVFKILVNDILVDEIDSSGEDAVITKRYDLENILPFSAQQAGPKPYTLRIEKSDGDPDTQIGFYRGLLPYQEEPVMELRFDDCELQTSFDGENWQAVPGFDPDCWIGPQGPPGADGADGGDGPAGPAGPQGTPGEGGLTDIGIDQTLDVDTYGGIAAYLTNWHDDLWRWYLDESTTSANLGAFLGSIGLTIFAGPGISFVVNRFVGYLAGALNIGASSLKNDVTPAVLENIMCLLYCEMMNNGWRGIATINAWSENVKNAYPVLSNTGAWYWGEGIGNVDYATWAFRAKIGELQPTDAPSVICECGSDDPFYWVVEWDFTELQRSGWGEGGVYPGVNPIDGEFRSDGLGPSDLTSAASVYATRSLAATFICNPSACVVAVTMYLNDTTNHQSIGTWASNTRKDGVHTTWTCVNEKIVILASRSGSTARLSTRVERVRLQGYGPMPQGGTFVSTWEP